MISIRRADATDVSFLVWVFQLGLVMCRFRDLSIGGLETPGMLFFLGLPDSFFTPDARSCEVFVPRPQIDLNIKMGYREIRRGPIWDEIERVSLVRDL